MKIILLKITFTFLCNFCNWRVWNRSDEYSDDKDDLIITCCSGCCSTPARSPYGTELLISSSFWGVLPLTAHSWAPPQKWPMTESLIIPIPGASLPSSPWLVNIGGRKPGKITSTWNLNSWFQFKISSWD